MTTLEIILLPFALMGLCFVLVLTLGWILKWDEESFIKEDDK
jgi:hypothetical protein